MVLQLTFPALATDCALFRLLAQLVGIFPVFGPTSSATSEQALPTAGVISQVT